MKNSRLYHQLLQWDTYFFNFLRISIFIVMAWIGGLKAFHYEADGIVPFVANSPLMSFFFYKNADHKVIKEDKNGLQNTLCIKILKEKWFRKILTGIRKTEHMPFPTV